MGSEIVDSAMLSCAMVLTGLLLGFLLLKIQGE
jgi:hypothetical protein